MPLNLLLSPMGLPNRFDAACDGTKLTKGATSLTKPLISPTEIWMSTTIILPMAQRKKQLSPVGFAPCPKDVWMLPRLQGGTLAQFLTTPNGA